MSFRKTGQHREDAPIIHKSIFKKCAYDVARSSLLHDLDASEEGEQDDYGVIQ